MEGWHAEVGGKERKPRSRQRTLLIFWRLASPASRSMPFYTIYTDGGGALS